MSLDEGNNVILEDNNTNQDVNTTSVYSYETQKERFSIDGEKVGYYVLKTLDVLFIIAAFIGILAVLSYPIIHTVKHFVNIDDFMNKLPVGYLSSVTIESFKNVEPITMIVFGVICLLIGIKMFTSLIDNYSIQSRICCILLGSGFMYLMISKEANALLLQGLEFLTTIILIVLFIPLLEAALWMATPLHGFLPPAGEFCKKYYGGLLKIFFRKN